MISLVYFIKNSYPYIAKFDKSLKKKFFNLKINF